MSRFPLKSAPAPAPLPEQRPESAGPEAASRQPCPWDDLDPDGTGLSVEDFLTTRMNLVTNALRRTITLPYAQAFGLTMPEWRILSVLAHAGEMPFTELVTRSATDKGQLSRTLRALQERGLVATRNRATGKKLDCLITREGRALHDKVFPVARRAQAAMIRELDPQERRVLYGAIQKLGELCGQGPEDLEE